MVTKIKEQEMYYLSNDLVFKHIFGTKENVRFTADLLESFYNYEKGSLKGLKVINSYKPKSENIKDKKYELDVLVKLKSGDLINLEMYNNYDLNAEKKSVLYISKIISKKAIKRGEEYNLANSVQQLNFVKGDKVHQSEDIIRKYIIINEKDGRDIMVPDIFQIYIINIDDKEKISYTNINKRLKLWLELLGIENKEDLEKIAKKDSLIGEVVEEMKRYNSDDWVQDYNSHEILMRSQFHTEKEEAVEKAEKKGINEGAKKKQLEIAKNLLKQNKLSFNDIADTTSLSIKVIEKLAQDLK